MYIYVKNKYKFGNRFLNSCIQYSNSMPIDAYRFQVRENSVLLTGPSGMEVNLKLPIIVFVFKFIYFGALLGSPLRVLF